MLAAGQAGQPDTHKTVDAWAGEITKQWSSLVAQKQKARGSKPQAPNTAPSQEGNEGINASQDEGSRSQALDFSNLDASAGRCLLAHIARSVVFAC